MARLTPLIFLPAFALANHQHGAESDVSLIGFKGTLLNENGPYLVRADHGALYRCEWLGGSNRWFEGDRVYLTRTSGMADMIKLGEDTSARVWVEEVDMGIGRAWPPAEHQPQSFESFRLRSLALSMARWISPGSGWRLKVRNSFPWLARTTMDGASFTP